MIEVDPIEMIMKARRKCPGYVGTWTVDALAERIEKRKETIRQREEEIAETKRKSLRRRLHKGREA